MELWNQAVEVLREAMFAYAQATTGSLAVGIIAVTFLARLALFPLTLRLARASAAHQAAMRKIQPQLEALRRRFKGEPERVATETRRLLVREKVTPLPTAGCAGTLLQAPILLALFSAARRCAAVGGRFWWVGDIAKPDVVLAVVVALLTAASVLAGPQIQGQHRARMIAVPVILTLVALSKMAAGIGLYWGVSSAFSVVQGRLAKRHLSRAAA